MSGNWKHSSLPTLVEEDADDTEAVTMVGLAGCESIRPSLCRNRLDGNPSQPLSVEIECMLTG